MCILYPLGYNCHAIFILTSYIYLNVIYVAILLIQFCLVMPDLLWLTYIRTTDVFLKLKLYTIYAYAHSNIYECALILWLSTFQIIYMTLAINKMDVWVLVTKHIVNACQEDLGNVVLYT